MILLIEMIAIGTERKSDLLLVPKDGSLMRIIERTESKECKNDVGRYSLQIVQTD